MEQAYDSELEAEQRRLQQQINSSATERAALEAKHGQVWNTAELQQDYTVEAFEAPLVVARRRNDGVRGSLFFQDSPRFYWGFQEHR